MAKIRRKFKVGDLIRYRAVRFANYPGRVVKLTPTGYMIFWYGWKELDHTADYIETYYEHDKNFSHALEEIVNDEV